MRPAPRPLPTALPRVLATCVVALGTASFATPVMAASAARTAASPAAPASAATAAAGDAPGATVDAPDPVVEALSTDGTANAPIPLRRPSDRNGAYVAKVLRPAVVRSRPRSDARRVGVATDRTAYLQQGTRLMILAARYDDRGRPWLRVQLPVRPNGTAGWMPAEAAVVVRTPWGIRVQLRARRVSVFRDGRLVRRASAVVGAPATPTPRGLFAIYEKAPQRDPRGFTGPWALNLTGFSTVLENFGSGPGKVAIHGRDGASFEDPLGTARSHGCVRVDNAVVAWIQRHVGNGTPVRVTAS